MSVINHAALIKACANGRQSALKELMEAEGGRMLGVALRMLRRQDLAEDAVQDSFVLLWRRAGQFDAARGSAKGWIYTILRNRCLTLLRNSDREISVDPQEQEVAGDDHVLDSAWNRLDAASDLRMCLELLEPERRSAILSCYILGYSHGELAGRMQAPLGSVKSWIRRGLQKLRECMG
ncbi:sigma-70 family RNA polymerase sigma factor [Hoeflea sp. WL0058]|uniref:Sigma-70 family RNA polymerase sigma factor n=1 Tax=Flavimaribacter sediminis TaxID=2865987 RepID=A0AAE3D0G6_9HYPH|nr:sigma-70 family RNA polymerase sigma factor [Flavimaribacter sediminis]MBW8636726.1 sigma-70 family RNA polymerase sigma factor [Flavimaribacter sediminis]